jgi:uncharacterized protein
MTENSILFLFIFAFVAFMIGVAKGGLGGLVGALAAPIMALVMPIDRVIGLILPVMMFADLFGLAFHWRKWNVRLILLILPGAIIGVTIGTLFITNTPTEALQTALVVIILIFVFYKLFEKRILGSLTYESKNWHGWLAGTITGFSSALAHTGAPPVNIYLLMQDITPRVFVATAALFFFILNWIKVPYYFYARLFDFPTLFSVAWLLPLVPLGAWFGRWFVGRVNKKGFERVIIVLLVISALILIFA